MTAGEIKALIKYRNNQAPQEPNAHYEELLKDLKEAQKNERSRNPSS
jgi:hypothetical protein